MSRSGYVDDDCHDPHFARWRGAVTKAMKGKRGQAFLKELLAEMEKVEGTEDAILITAALQDEEGDYCALGMVGRARGTDMTKVDPEDPESVASLFGIARAMACEIQYMNDEYGRYDETPQDRFTRMKKWVEKQILEEVSSGK